MKLIKHDDGIVRRPPVPNSPTVTVIFGGGDDSPDVGLVRVRVPGGGGMPPHRHNGSDVIVTPMTGMVQISKDDEVINVHVGDSALVLRDEEVSLTNPGNDAVEVIVAAGPSHFVAAIRGWPELSDQS